MKRNFLSVGALILGLAVLAAACGDDDDSSSGNGDNGGGSPPAGQTLVVAAKAMPLGIDAHYISGNEPTWLSIPTCYEMAQMFNIISYPYDDPPEGSGANYLDLPNGPQPWFFESWELSADGKSATIKITPGVKSAPGNELTAEDVKWTVERAAASGNIGTFFTAAVLNLTENDPVEVIDKYTFKINSNEPNELLVSLWTNSYFPVYDSTEAKKHVTADDPWATEWLATNCAGFGAYTVESWDAGQGQVVWAKNPNYFGETGNIDRIVYRVVPDSSTRLAALKAGDVDIAEHLSSGDWKAAQGSSGVKVQAVQNNLIIFAYMNANHEPAFADVKVRRALNYVVPRQELADSVWQGQAKPWRCAMTSIFPGAACDLWPWGDEPDFDKAQQLLDEAGYGDGLNLTLSYSTAAAWAEQTANLLKANAAKVGVNITLNPMADGEFAAGTMANEIAFGLFQDTPIQPDPFYWLMINYYTPDIPMDYSDWKDDETVRLLDAARPELTLDGKIAATRPAQERILDQVPILWMVEPYYTIAMRDNVDGYTWYNTQYYLFKDLTKR